MENLPNWMNWCRLCAQQDLTNKDNIEYNTISTVFPELYNIFPKIDLDDRKPQRICSTCNETIQKLNLFLQKCHNSDQMYSNILNELKHTPSNSEENSVEDEEFVKPKIELDSGSSNVSSSSDRDDNSITPDELISAPKTKKHPRCKRNDDEYVKCELCDKVFDKRRNYRTHLNAKHGSLTFYCTTCPKSFTTKNSLRQHEKTHLPDVEKLVHPCLFCEKRFSKSANAKAHMSSIHQNETNWICDVCAKRFSTKSQLVAHKTSHSDDRPFECTKCLKKFKSRYMLKIHEDTHPDTKYPCETCGAILNTKKNLRLHQAVHTEQKFTCTECDKEYKTKESLKSHLISHTGYRHECTLCDKSFVHKRNLRDHEKRRHPTMSA